MTTVSRVTGSMVYYTVRIVDSTQPAKELFSAPDWSRVRDIEGKETMVNKPLSFPLAPGKTWDIHYTEQHPNKQFRVEEWTHKYMVVGFKPVDVPAERFNALKIESEGQWTAELLWLWPPCWNGICVPQGTASLPGNWQEKMSHPPTCCRSSELRRSRPRRCMTPTANSRAVAADPAAGVRAERFDYGDVSAETRLAC